LLTVVFYLVHYPFGAKVKASNMGDIKNFEFPLQGIIKNDSSIIQNS
jgi:hypothetical protein